MRVGLLRGARGVGYAFPNAPRDPAARRRALPPQAEWRPAPAGLFPDRAATPPRKGAAEDAAAAAPAPAVAPAPPKPTGVYRAPHTTGAVSAMMAASRAPAPTVATSLLRTAPRAVAGGVSARAVRSGVPASLRRSLRALVLM